MLWPSGRRSGRWYLWHLDGTGNDRRLGLFDLRHDVVDEATTGGVADAVDREVVAARAGSERAVDRGLDHVVHGHVDTLDHRRQHVLLYGWIDRVVLIGVDADAPDFGARGSGGIGCRLEHAGAREPRCGIDDVGALRVHRRRDL